MATKNSIKSLPSVEEITRVLVYNPASGILEFIDPKRKLNSSGAGYLGVFFNGRQYLAHRIIWKILTGFDPTGEVDHINGDRQDNRQLNLRDVGSIANNCNRRVSSKSVTGVKNVFWDKKSKKWKVCIISKGEVFYEWYLVFEDACAAAIAMRFRLHGAFANDGRRPQFT